MYSYEWDKRTRGYRLTTQAEKFVAQEVRPVYAEELGLLGFDAHFRYDAAEQKPLMWCRNNSYIYNGEEVAVLHNTRLGYPLDVEYLTGKRQLLPVDIEAMTQKNKAVMDLLVANTVRRIKETYEAHKKYQDVIYIAFSGGKDSVLLLDLCDKVLPQNCPVVFSDTTMELPDSYKMWEDIQKRYPERKFLKFSAEKTALENWQVFGPPSQSIDWCCAVHKSAPAIIQLKNYFNKSSLRALVFLGIRRDEGLIRDRYEGDVAVGVKNASQVNIMPIDEWGTHELFLYTFANNLPMHRAYRLGLPRVGCLMCPKASMKFMWFKYQIYSQSISPYINLLFSTTTRIFESEDERRDFLASSSWQARRNGLELKQRISALEEKNAGMTTIWNHLNIRKELFLEWLKSVGRIEQQDESHYTVLRQISPTQRYGCQLELEIKDSHIQTVRCIYEVKSSQEKKNLHTHLTRVLCKATACVGCRACEAECAFGALHISADTVRIDVDKCAHCLKCHDIDYGCWRYKSMMTPNSTNSPLKSIGNYQTFGLRQSWVELYSSERENFKNTLSIGGPMIDSARIWFKQCYLTEDSKSLKPGKLLELANMNGAADDLLWSLIWIALCNNSPLVKWFVTNVPFDQKITADNLMEKLGDIVSPSARRGGLQALFNCFKESPLGQGAKPMVQLDTKGKRVTGATRVRRSIEPLAVLYSLYVMGLVSERNGFTISEMMQTDFDSPFISPLTAFGMEVEELKGQCLGIATRYPRFLSCIFTLGLDEVRIFPEEKGLDDVLGLMLGED